MENELSAAQNAAYDYQRCARVWQRVDPTLDPYPDVCAAAARVLRWGGRFALVHRPERLSDLFCTLRAHGLEPKRLRFVASSAENAPFLALVEARRGGNASLSVEPMLFIGSADWDEVYFRT